MKPTTCVLAAVAVVLYLCVQINCSLNYHRIHLVDFNTTTQQYLFRGNFPANDSKSFAYDNLIDSVRRKAKEENGIDLPATFQLVDISFLESHVNKKDLEIERNFFHENPTLGTFVHWTVIGHPLNPSSLSSSFRKKMALYTSDWDIKDQLVPRVEQLHKWVHSYAAAPTVYYMHCEAGVDRTGEVSGAYYMKYLKWSFLKALQYDYDISPRPISKWNQNAMDWYCWWMYYTVGYPTDCSSTIPN